MVGGCEWGVVMSVWVVVSVHELVLSWNVFFVL